MEEDESQSIFLCFLIFNLVRSINSLIDFNEILHSESYITA